MSGMLCSHLLYRLVDLASCLCITIARLTLTQLSSAFLEASMTVRVAVVGARGLRGLALRYSSNCSEGIWIRWMAAQET
jgi:hypothetical protein